MTITNNKNNKNNKNKILETNTKELKVGAIKEEPIKVEAIKVETIKLDKTINSNINSNNDLKIGIQDVKDINLNIDYELDSPNESSSPVQEEVEAENALEEESNYQEDDIYDDKESRWTEDLEDEDEDNNIDYETLNDLEVIVFDE